MVCSDLAECTYLGLGTCLVCPWSSAAWSQFQRTPQCRRPAVTTTTCLDPGCPFFWVSVLLFVVGHIDINEEIARHPGSCKDPSTTLG